MTEIEGGILLNGKVLDYLIHGQSCTIDFKLLNCKYLVFYHRVPFMGSYHKAREFRPGEIGFWNIFRVFGNIKIKKNPGKINFLANAYYPNIQLYIYKNFWSIKPQKLSIELKINFINAVQHDVLTSNNEVMLKKNSDVIFEQPALSPEKKRIELNIGQPILYNNQLNLIYQKIEN